MLKDIIGASVHYCRDKSPKAFFSLPTPSPQDAPSNFLFFVHRGRAHFSFRKMQVIGARGDVLEWDLASTGFKKIRLLPGGDFSYTFLVFDLFSSGGKRVTLSQLGFPFRIKLRSPGKIRKVLSRITAAVRGSGEYYHLESSALVLGLLKELFSQVPPSQPKAMTPDTIDPRIETVLRHIEQNYKDRLTLKSLAARACMHPVYFSVLFRKHTGMSPHQYILERKVEFAKNFLDLWDEGIVNTAEHLGFHDYSHFYRSFRRIAGMTPGEYIRRYKFPPGRVVTAPAKPGSPSA
jgi:AraC-like DNA-binding protein